LQVKCRKRLRRRTDQTVERLNSQLRRENRPVRRVRRAERHDPLWCRNHSFEQWSDFATASLRNCKSLGMSRRRRTSSYTLTMRAEAPWAIQRTQRCSNRSEPSSVIKRAGIDRGQPFQNPTAKWTMKFSYHSQGEAIIRVRGGNSGGWGKWSCRWSKKIQPLSFTGGGTGCAWEAVLPRRRGRRGPAQTAAIRGYAEEVWYVLSRERRWFTGRDLRNATRTATR